MLLFIHNQLGGGRVRILFIKVLVTLFLRFFGKNKLSILTYHRVGNSGDAAAMEEHLFEQHLLWVKRYLKPIDLKDALSLQAKGKLPRGAVAITVDDGYVDSFSTIFPLLKKYNLLATFFITTSGFDKGYLWDEKIAYIIMQTHKKCLSFNGNTYSLTTHSDRISCLQSCLTFIKYKSIVERDLLIEELVKQSEQYDTPRQFLTKQQTLELYQAGMGIGSHTHTHPILAKENPDTALAEIEQSKVILENIINQPVDYFAYPNGKFGLDFDSDHIEMVKKCGFLAALSTDKGVLANQGLDNFNIKRFTPWDETEFKFVLRLALNYC